MKQNVVLTQVDLVVTEENVIDLVWTEENGRPPVSQKDLVVHPLQFAGESWQAKVTLVNIVVSLSFS